MFKPLYGIIGALVITSTYFYLDINKSTPMPAQAFSVTPPLIIQPLEQLSYYKVKPIVLSKKDIKCLELNVFHEAGAESYEGKIAVAQVTYNRVKTNKWGSTLCSVIYAPHQFSWTKQKKRQPKTQDLAKSKLAVKEFISGIRIEGLQKSLHYHATWIDTPFWVSRKTEVNRIGQHVFYKPKYKVEYVISYN